MMKRAFPLVVITAGLLLSLAAFAQMYRSNREPVTTSGTLPVKIGGLDLNSSESGEAAISEFTSMHGKEFPVTSGDIGHYGNGWITLWVAGTSTDPTAAEMVSGMQARIAKGNSPFTPVREIKNGNRTVYVLDGMGQKHFYFQSKNLVIWLASDASVADRAIQQILEVYP
jgi:hypothetical protein